MSLRRILLIVLLGILAGLVLGVIAGSLLIKPAVTLDSNAVELAPPEQDDFIIMVAEAYAGDHDLTLAQDRLRRLQDAAIAARVEKLAIEYAPQGDLIASRLAKLAVALGSNKPDLIKLIATVAPTGAATQAATSAPTSTPTSPP